MATFANEAITSSTRIAAGKPPNVDRILIPLISAKLIITHATKPTVTPQAILIANPPSGLSGEIPEELIAAIAVVFESADVTKQMNVLQM